MLVFRRLVAPALVPPPNFHTPPLGAMVEVKIVALNGSLEAASGPKVEVVIT